MISDILNKISSIASRGKKMFSVLIDPDFDNIVHLEKLISLCNKKKVDFIFTGGSLLSNGNIDKTIDFIKNMTDIPVVIFPGSPSQISSKGDALLLLSLVSGRNPDFLIGKHVEAAIELKNSKIEIIPTAYLLIDGGNKTTASYISFTNPLPADKPMLTAATALAAQQLGMKLIYLDCGSGAKHSVSDETISAVKKYTELPLIVGGGIDSAEKIENAYNAGADMVVLGTVFEKNPEILNEFI
ncbi:MAG: geranylgeranylglyceryl/heptaprenylglyceryl phosphate synthase [Bacteroidetes bacterium]|nr:geranylgeranylglyceryl/heptaprenylglyceryl phosphate synthase [Bacteroidota bacterium]